VNEKKEKMESKKNKKKEYSWEEGGGVWKIE